jgi:uncharacterized membrane protein YhhN
MNFGILTPIYFFALAIEIFANLTGNLGLQYFSKPSLMVILIFYFAVNTRKLGRTKRPIIAALAFSWLGDVLLLLDKQTKSLFIYGLLAFLTAHIFYIFYFLSIRRANGVEKLPNALIFAGIAAYTLGLFAFLAPHVGQMLVPVGVYALVISLMLAASVAAFDFRRQSFGVVAVAGTALFIVSDSILAINRFAAPFALAPVFVMTTYAVAQLLIVESSLRNLREFFSTRRREDEETQSL